MTSSDEMTYPPWLRRILHSAFGVTYVLVLLFPVAAALESLLQPGLPRFDAGGSSIMSRLVVSVLVLTTTVTLLLLPSPRRTDRSMGPVLMPLRALSIFLAVWGAASLTSTCTGDSLQSWITWLVAALFLVASREAGGVHSALKLVLLCILTVGGVVALLGTDVVMTPGIVENHAFTGAFYQADIAAGFMLLLVPIALAFLVGAQGWVERVFYGALAVLLLTSLLLTYSRGGEIAMVVSLAVLARLLWGTCRWRAVAAPFGVLVVAIAFAGVIASHGHAIIPARTIERGLDLVGAGKRTDTSVTARLDFIRGAWSIAEARPILGWGPATFGRIFPRYQPGVQFYSKYAHNEYATILAESGFVGLAAFLVFVGALAAAAIFVLRTIPPGRNRTIPCGIIASLSGAIFHIGVDVDWEFPMLQLIFFGLAGLLLSNGAIDGGQFHELESSTLRTLEKSQAAKPPNACHLTPATRAISCACVSMPRTLQADRVSRRALRRQWLLCLLVLVLIVLQGFPTLSHLYSQSAVVARQRGNVDAAVEAQRQAVKAMPFSSLAWQNLADVLMAKAENDSSKSVEGGAAPGPSKAATEAVEAASRAVKLDPERAVNHEMLARALNVVGKSGEEEQSLRNAIRCDPVNYPRFYNRLAELFVRNKREIQASELLRAIASRYPSEVFPDMWYFRGDTLKEQLAQTWFILATLDQKQQRQNDARAGFARSVELHPNNIAARFQLGTMQMNNGQPGLAFEQFRAIQQLKPTNAISQWLMGLCYRELGQFVRSSQLLHEAYRQLPGLRVVGPHAPLRIPPDFFEIRPRMSLEGLDVPPREREPAR